MKKYHFDKPRSFGTEKPNTVTIYNDDENPVIRTIECAVNFHPIGEIPLWSVYLVLNENLEIREKFYKVTNIHYFAPLGDESLVNQSDRNNVFKFFAVIQQIDPLPLSVFTELKALINFDITDLIFLSLIEEKVKEKKYQEALVIALEEDKKGDVNAMPVLANLYEKNNDYVNYINVITHFPKTHESFRSVNEILHGHLQSIPIPSDDNKKTRLLEQRLRVALNAELTGEASCYFDQLCGNNGLDPSVKNVKGDADTLIQIAQVQSQMKKELEMLKAAMKKETDNNLKFNDDPETKANRIGFFNG